MGIVVLGALGTPSKPLLSALPDLTTPHFGLNILGLMFPEAKANTQILGRQKAAIKGKSLLKDADIKHAKLTGWLNAQVIWL